MNRRRFLASSGALLLAGCSEPAGPTVPLRYLAAGDSITKNRGDGNVTYPFLASEDVAHFSAVINSGTDSWKITDLWAHMAEKVLDFDFDVASFMFGTNDHQFRADPSWHVPLEVYAATYEKVIEAVGPERVVLMTPPFITGIPGRHDNARLSTYAAAVRKLAKEYRTGLVDVHAITTGWCEGDPTRWRAEWTDTDGIHLNSRAHAALYPYVRDGVVR